MEIAVPGVEQLIEEPVIQAPTIVVCPPPEPILLPLEAEFIAAWNAAGLPMIAALDALDRVAFAARCGDERFAQSWRAALERVRKDLTLGEFLEDGFVESVPIGDNALSLEQTREISHENR